MTIGTTKVQMAAEVGLALIQQLDEQNEQLSIGVATVKNAFDLEITNILQTCIPFQPVPFLLLRIVKEPMRLTSLIG